MLSPLVSRSASRRQSSADNRARSSTAMRRNSASFASDSASPVSEWPVFPDDLREGSSPSSATGLSCKSSQDVAHPCQTGVSPCAPDSGCEPLRAETAGYCAGFCTVLAKCSPVVCSECFAATARMLRRFRNKLRPGLSAGSLDDPEQLRSQIDVRVAVSRDDVL